MFEIAGDDITLLTDENVRIVIGRLCAAGTWRRIRKLRGRWQAMVRRKGMAPRAKSFDAKFDAERWARSLEAQVDRCGVLPDTRSESCLASLGASARAS